MHLALLQQITDLWILDSCHVISGNFLVLISGPLFLMFPLLYTPRYSHHICNTKSPLSQRLNVLSTCRWLDILLHSN